MLVSLRMMSLHWNDSNVIVVEVIGNVILVEATMAMMVWMAMLMYRLVFVYADQLQFGVTILSSDVKELWVV